MATNVTVTEAYIDHNQYGSRVGGGSSYSYTTIVNEGSSGVSWLGDTPNAVGTYGGVNTIIANDSLVYHDVVGTMRLEPTSNYGAALGRSTNKFSQLHVSSIYGEVSLVTGVTYIGDLNTGFLLSSAGDLTFQDAVYGSSVTLSELASTVDDVWSFSSAGDAVMSTPDTDILLNVGSEKIKWTSGWYIVDNYNLIFGYDDSPKVFLSSTEFSPLNNNTIDIGDFTYYWKDLYLYGKAYFTNTSVYVNSDGSNLQFTDSVVGSLTLSEILNDNDFTHSTSGFMYTDGAGGYSVDDNTYLTDSDRYWSRSGTNLSPATAGDDILLPDNSYRISFGDGDTYFYESADDHLSVIASGTNVIFSETVSTFYKDIIPNNNTLDLGAANDNFWANLYVDKIYLETVGNVITIDSAGEMTFADGITGEVKLSDFQTIPIFDRSGHEVSFVNTDDYIQFATGGNEGIFFGSIDTGITEPTDNHIHLISNSSDVIDFYYGAITTYSDVVPDTPSVRDLGSSSLFYAESYINTMYVKDSSTYITRDGSNELSFTDAVSGTVALSDLGLTDGDKGDITVSGSGATWTINNSAVTLAKIENISTSIILGRVTGGSGVIEQLTGTQATTLLDTFATDATTKGLVPGSNSVGSSYFLCADGTWDIPAGTGGSGSGGGSYTGLGIHSTISSTQCTADATTNINIGSTSTDVALTVEYIADRGSERRFGTFYIMYDGTNINSGYGHSIGPSLGMTLSADQSSGNIRIKVTVDDSDSTDIDFEGYVTFAGSPTYDVEFHVDGVTEGYFDSNGLHLTNRIYLGNSSTYIEKDVSGNMQFTDAVAGTWDLADLIGGSGWSGGGGGGGDVYASGTLTDNYVMVGAGATTISTADSTVNFAGQAITNVDSITINNGYDLLSGSSKTGDIGSSGSFWDNAYFDRVYIDNTNAYIDVSGTDMIFYSADYPSGKTITDLLAGGGGGDVVASGTLTDNYVMVGNGTTSISVADTTVNFASQGITNVDGIAVNSGNNITISANKQGNIGSTGAFWNYAYFDRVYVDSTSVYLDVSGTEFLFHDVNGDTLLSDMLGATTSPFEEDSANNVVFVTPGKDLLLRNSGERIIFGDGDTYVYESSDDVITIYTGGTQAWSFSSPNVQSARNLLPASSDQYNIGGTSNFWVNFYANRWYIDDTSTYIYNNGGAMTFVDGSGSYALSSLGGGGGGDVYADTYTTYDFAVWASTSKHLRDTSGVFTYNSGTGAIYANPSSFTIASLMGGGDHLVKANSSGSLGSGDLTGDVTTSSGLVTTIASGAVEYGMLNNNVISGRTALTSGLASTDELFVSDGGILKKMDVSVLESYMQTYLTFSDITIANEYNYRILTSVTTDSINAEANLTFDGSTLTVTGNTRISGLGGGGNKMVIVDNDGDLSTDDIPTGGGACYYSKTDTTAYSTGGAQELYDTISLTNSEYEGSADGTKIWVLTLRGRFGSSVTNNDLQVLVRLGTELISSAQIANAPSANESFYMVFIFSANSSTNTVAQNEVHSESFNAIGLGYDTSVTHGTGDNLKIYVDTGGGGGTHFCYIYHCTLECLES